MANSAASCLPTAVPAVVAALRADATLTGLLGGARVYARVPDDQEPPYLWVLGGEEGPANQFGGYGREATIDVVAVSRYRGTAEVDALTSRVMELLDNTTLTLSGYGQGQLLWQGNRRPELADVNGELYYQRLATFGVRAS